MTQKRTNLLLWIVVGGGAFLFFILVLLGLVVYFADGGSRSLSLSDGKVALLKLEGVISDSREFLDDLKDYGNRSGVRAVVIRVDSPGGGVAASQEIYDGIKRFRSESGKKVVVSMASVAASADTILLAPPTESMLTLDPSLEASE